MRNESNIKGNLGVYRLAKTDIGEGTYSSVSLFMDVMESPSQPNLYAVKSISLSNLRVSQVPVYGPEGLVDVCSGKFQLEREIAILDKLASSKCKHLISIREIVHEEELIHVVYPYRGYPVMSYSDNQRSYSACTRDRVYDYRTAELSDSDPVHLLTRDDAIECMRQLLSAVKVVHDNGICHKDIKPENILIMSPLSRWWSEGILQDSRQPSPIHLTLSDFNTAEFTRESGKIYDAQGTVLFSPPEAFTRAFKDSEDQAIDGYARDMWSVGMVGYSLLIGTLPLKGKSPIEIQLELVGMAQEAAQIPNIVLPSDLPSIETHPTPAIRTLVESLLSIVPSKRPSAKQAIEIIK